MRSCMLLRRTACLALFLWMLAFAGCGVDFYADERPIDYPNTKWISKTPEISFVVIEGLKCFGKIVADGRTIPIHAVFDYGNGLVLSDASEPETITISGPTILNGQCEFYPDKFILRDIDDRYGLLGEFVKEIVFDRTDWGEAPPAYPNTQWVSEQLGIVFSVGADGVCRGTAVAGERNILVEARFDRFLELTVVDVGVEAEDVAPGASKMLRGTCEYYPDRFIVTDIEDLYGVFETPKGEIVFKRMEPETKGQG